MKTLTRDSILSRIKNFHCKTIPNPGLKDSAVLVPLGIIKDEICLLYTQRSINIKHHAGQISFPGGRLESNETAWQCAIRETEEEVGIPRGSISYFGRLNDVLSPRGFHVQTHVGWVVDTRVLLNYEEVEKVFWVPVSELLDPKRHETKPWKHIPGIDVHYFNFSNCLVWGVTGKMSFGLRELLNHD